MNDDLRIWGIDSIGCLRAARCEAAPHLLHSQWLFLFAFLFALLGFVQVVRCYIVVIGQLKAGRSGLVLSHFTSLLRVNVYC